jgi:very-short-patch-repair endonuclease
MASLLRRFQLPMPVPQHTVLDDHGGFVARVDFAYPELKYAIEVDGYAAHSELRAFRHDRSRQNDLVDSGWVVHRFTAKEIEDHPSRVAFRIAERHATLLGTLTRPQAG